ALDRGPPEGLPGGRREVVPDLIGRQAEELLLIFLFPGSFRVGLGAGLLVQALPGVAIAAANALEAAALAELGEQVAGDAVEPAAERALLRVVVPAAGGAGNGQEDFLRQVHRVGVLQAAAAGEAVDQAAVQFDELLPGGAVPRVAQAGEQ